MARTTEELVLQVSATQELLERQLKAMGQNVETFDQAAEQRLELLQQKFSGINLTAAVDAVKDADKAFKSSFDNINRQASELAQTLGKNGVVDLSPLIAQSQARAKAMEAEATVLSVLANAEANRVASIERATVADQASVAAARAAASASLQRSEAAGIEVQRLEALQAELGTMAGAQARVTTTSNAQRFALVNVGNQFQDFFVQVSGGTSALRAFSQQAPQLIGAFQMMALSAEEGKGKFATFANFLAGPWGVALGVAIPLVGILGQNLFSMGEKADDAKGKVDGLRSAINSLINASGKVDFITYGEVQSSIQVKQVQLARLNKDISETEAASRVTAAGGSNAAFAFASSRLGDLQKQRDALQSDIGGLQAQLSGVDKQIQARNKFDQGVRDQEAADKAARAAESAAKKAANAEVSAEKKAAREAAKELADFYKSRDAQTSDLINGRVVPLKPTGILSADGEKETSKLTDQILEADERMKTAQRDLAAIAQGTQEAWVSSAQGIINSVQQMKGALSGDFLDILSAALGLFTQLGSIGAFGSGIQNGINFPNVAPLGKRATGGPVTGGTPYLVGERGPELFVPSASGTIVANDNLSIPRVSQSDYASRGSGAAIRVLVEANDYFTARVQAEAAVIAAPVGVAAAQGGATLANQRASDKFRRRIPSAFG